MFGRRLAVTLVPSSKKTPTNPETAVKEPIDIENLVLTLEGSAMRVITCVAYAGVLVIAARTMGSICDTVVKSVYK
jgi:hypothetical protein